MKSRISRCRSVSVSAIGTFPVVPEQSYGTERALTLSIFLPVFYYAHMMLAVGPLVVVLDLAAAHARGDLDEVGRLASMQGASGIAPLLEATDPAVLSAGLAAAPSAPDAWELLDELAVL